MLQQRSASLYWDKKESKVDNNKKPNEIKEFSDVNLTENNWWRKPTEFEDPKLLEEIENYMNSLEQDHYNNLLDIFTKQGEMVLSKLDSMLKDKISLEEIFYTKMETVDGSENILLWQPLRNKMLNSLSSYMKEAYMYGKQTALEELNSSEGARFDKDSLIFIKNRSRTLVDKYFANFKYLVELSLLSASSENKTNEDIVNDVKKGFNTIKDRDLKNMVETEGMFFLNKGRSYIAKENI